MIVVIQCSNSNWTRYVIIQFSWDLKCGIFAFLIDNFIWLHTGWFSLRKCKYRLYAFYCAKRMNACVSYCFMYYKSLKVHVNLLLFQQNTEIESCSSSEWSLCTQTRDAMKKNCRTILTASTSIWVSSKTAWHVLQRFRSQFIRFCCQETAFAFMACPSSVLSW